MSSIAGSLRPRLVFISVAIDRIADRAPVHANRTLAYIKAFFSWAVSRGYLEVNPAAAMAKPIREVIRDRAPDLLELVEIWNAAGLLGYPLTTPRKRWTHHNPRIRPVVSKSFGT